jgi:arylsulfatase A-like enzyme
VDFKPTLLALMGVSSAGGDEGRDASALFRTGQAPAAWQNITFSRNSAGNWLMAATSRYKFIISNDSNPCLFDLDADPFEMRNIFAAPSSRETVRELGRALAEYAKRCKEPYADQPAVRADLAWAAEGTGKYVAPQRNVNKTKARKVRAAADDE